MRDFILQNRHRRVEDVALELSRRQDLDAPFILRQIEGWQKMRTKVPRWTEVDDIHFPPRLALEQCSGQPAAEYKASVVRRLLQSSAEADTSMTDLTGGMGVDFSFIAPLFNKAIYIEQRSELVETARHNFPLLGLRHATILEGDGITFLKTLQPQTLIFLDPARRDSHGGKTVLIEDCEPNVAQLLPELLEKCQWLMVKLSTMLDVHRAIATLHSVENGCVKEVHVFAAGGECKDLLLVIRGRVNAETAVDAGGTEPVIYCADEQESFSFTFSEENAANLAFAEDISGFLYEPGPSIMKAGAYRVVAEKYGIQPLAANSHLYVSKQLAPHFQGRTFEIDKVYTFAKADLKTLSASLKAEGGKANLAIRNFPSTVAELRKKLKLKEGGTAYLFATTDKNQRKIIVSSKKV